MFNCIICTQKTDFAPKCHCHFCLLCLLNWFEEKNQEKRIDILKCPNTDCLCVYSRDEILHYCCHQPYERMFQEILFKEYLKNRDIRPCPNGKCKFYGFIELENKCDQELECLECGFKWRDYNQVPFDFRQEHIIKQIFGNIKQFWYCLVTANECPSCGILIQRIGGCKHMTCKVCAHQFCWHCKQQWLKHQESQCQCSQIISSGLLLILLFNILYQFTILRYILYVFYPFVWMFEIFIINFLVIGTLVGITGLVRSIWDMKSKKQPINNCLLLIGISILLLIIEYIVLGFSTVYLSITFQKAIYGFILEFFICILILSYQTKINYRWVFHIIIGLFVFYIFGLNGLAILVWKIPVIISAKYFYAQLNFSAIALGLLVLLNIFNLSELCSSRLFYLLLGSTILHYSQNWNDTQLLFISILVIFYIKDLMLIYI